MKGGRKGGGSVFSFTAIAISLLLFRFCTFPPSQPVRQSVREAVRQQSGPLAPKAAAAEEQRRRRERPSLRPSAL